MTFIYDSQTNKPAVLLLRQLLTIVSNCYSMNIVSNKNQIYLYKEVI